MATRKSNKPADDSTDLHSLREGKAPSDPATSTGHAVPTGASSTGDDGIERPLDSNSRPEPQATPRHVDVGTADQPAHEISGANPDRQTAVTAPSNEAEGTDPARPSVTPSQPLSEGGESDEPHSSNESEAPANLDTSAGDATAPLTVEQAGVITDPSEMDEEPGLVSQQGEIIDVTHEIAAVARAMEDEDVGLEYRLTNLGDRFDSLEHVARAHADWTDGDAAQPRKRRIVGHAYDVFLFATSPEHVDDFVEVANERGVILGSGKNCALQFLAATMGRTVSTEPSELFEGIKPGTRWKKFRSWEKRDRPNARASDRRRRPLLEPRS